MLCSWWAGITVHVSTYMITLPDPHVYNGFMVSEEDNRAGKNPGFFTGEGQYNHVFFAIAIAGKAAWLLPLAMHRICTILTDFCQI